MRRHNCAGSGVGAVHNLEIIIAQTRCGLRNQHDIAESESCQREIPFPIVQPMSRNSPSTVSISFLIFLRKPLHTIGRSLSHQLSRDWFYLQNLPLPQGITVEDFAVFVYHAFTLQGKRECSDIISFLPSRCSTLNREGATSIPSATREFCPGPLK